MLVIKINEGIQATLWVCVHVLCLLAVEYLLITKHQLCGYILRISKKTSHPTLEIEIISSV